MTSALIATAREPLLPNGKPNTTKGGPTKLCRGCCNPVSKKHRYWCPVALAKSPRRAENIEQAPSEVSR